MAAAAGGAASAHRPGQSIPSTPSHRSRWTPKSAGYGRSFLEAKDPPVGDQPRREETLWWCASPCPVVDACRRELALRRLHK